MRANSCPAPRDCASSFSWCGKTRSSPPPWISNDRPEQLLGHGRALDVPAGPAAPHGDVPAVSSPGLFAFQSAKSRGSSLSGFGSCSSTCVRPLAGQAAVLREARDAEVDVALDLVGEAALDQLLDERDDLGIVSVDLRVVVGPGRARSAGVLQVPLRRLARRARRSRPGAAS